MDNIDRSEQANIEILNNHFPDNGFIDDMLFTLSRAEGMIGLIGDAVTLAQPPHSNHEISMKNLERTVCEIEMVIKDAIIMTQDFCDQKNRSG